MYPVPTTCPVCQDDLQVTRLVCDTCDTVLEGRFVLDSLSRLSAEQRHFVQIFVRNEGKLNRVQEELGISYPTVRNRLNEVIGALGYEVEEKQPMVEEERHEILERLARQEISAQEAMQLLQE